MAGTIKEIAELAGVSRGTVDRALNDRGRIKPEVAERIKKIADELGYIPRKKKQAAGSSSAKLGVVTQLAKASFMVQVYKGIEDARKELNNREIEIYLEECESVDEEEQLGAISRLENRGITGLAIMPVESDKIRGKLNELIDKGIKVVTFNSDIVGTKRSCFIGLDNQKSGRTAAGLMGMLTGKEGKILAITGYFGNSVNSMRVDGFIQEIKENYPDMNLIGVQSSFDDEKEVESIIISALSTFPELKGIVVFSGGQSGVTKAFSKMKMEKRPNVIVYDLTKENIGALKKDVTDFVIDQNGYTQGYRSLMILANMIQVSQKPPKEFLYTDIIIKTKYNV